ncbi:MAG: crossover junction endodeoxyribonuclease RuvC [Gemmatimonadota bacterium]|nr:crossover junction endodeoxyribonuclease RuvC [Gemmatimonadota bacterium]
MSRRVLGIDPGTAATGYGVVEAEPGRLGRLVECGVLRTDRGDAMAERLVTLHQGMRDLLDQHHPDVVAVESIFYGKNVRTSLVMSHARGVILLAAAQVGVPVAEFAPAAVKKAVVGRGRATKVQVGFMVQQLLRLRQPPRPADAADGVAIALAYLITGPRR